MKLVKNNVAAIATEIRIIAKCQSENHMEERGGRWEENIKMKS
jgi:hypothetical protein